jgi:hypothetical protein
MGMEEETEPHNNEKPKKAKCPSAQDNTTASFMFKDKSCIHPHAKQYAKQSCTEKKEKTKTKIDEANVRQ